MTRGLSWTNADSKPAERLLGKMQKIPIHFLFLPHFAPILVIVYCAQGGGVNMRN